MYRGLIPTHTHTLCYVKKVSVCECEPKGKVLVFQYCQEAISTFLCSFDEIRDGTLSLWWKNIPK